MGLEPTTTGITIEQMENISVIRNKLKQLNQYVICSYLFSSFPVFCPLVCHECAMTYPSFVTVFAQWRSGTGLVYMTSYRE